MRQAAGERPYGFHLLRMAQGFFGSRPLAQGSLDALCSVAFSSRNAAWLRLRSAALRALAATSSTKVRSSASTPELRRG